jgi:hypothetical protein
VSEAPVPVKINNDDLAIVKQTTQKEDANAKLYEMTKFE